MKLWDQVVSDDVVVGEVGLPGLLDLVRPPTPSDGDSRVGDVIELVVVDGGALRVADDDADASAELRADVFEEVVVDAVVAGLLCDGVRGGASTPPS